MNFWDIKYLQTLLGLYIIFVSGLYFILNEDSQTQLILSILFTGIGVIITCDSIFGHNKKKILSDGDEK